MLEADQLPGFSLRFSLSGTLEFVNAPLLAVLGYSANELQGSPIDVILPVYTRIFFQTHLVPLLRLQGHAEEIFLSFVSSDAQELPMVLNFEKDRDRTEIVNALGIAVRQRKKYEDDLISTRRQLEKSIAENSELVKARMMLDERARQLDHSLYQLQQRHNSLQQFNKAITHDLQEPVRKLNFYHSIFNPGIDRLRGEDLSVIKKMKTAVDHLGQVVKGLQEFIWLSEGTGTSTTIDLNEVVAEAKSIVEVEMNAAAITVEVDHLPVLEGNKEQLVRMFTAIFENSIKFAKAATPVEIKVESRVVALNIFRNTEDRYDYADFIQVRIKDNGTGFDPDRSDAVFDVFTKLHHGEGQGLGLAICRRIVENHGGNIYAAPVPDIGTTIVAEFPWDPLESTCRHASLSIL